MTTAVEAPPTAPPSGATTTDADPEWGWRITWKGRSWTDQDLTGQHLSVLSLIVGSDEYELLDMDPRQGHQRLMNMIAALQVVAHSVDVDEVDALAGVLAKAINEIRETSAVEILGSIEFPT
ncbi:MAG: hypothetical protein AAGA42_14410 [Actinomycetota bacterium]